MRVFVFGNPDIADDSLPLDILPELKKRLPNMQWQHLDPNEEWDVPTRLVAIDTVVGIDRVTVFHNLEKFQSSPNCTLHDFDALAQLRLLQKLGKLQRVTIVGVPPMLDAGRAVAEVAAALAAIEP